MKLLKPYTVLVGGPLLLGVVVAAGAGIVDPTSRDLRGGVIMFMVATLFGLVTFGPIGVAGVMRGGFVLRHFERLDRWSSLVMALGMGHLLGSRLGDSGYFVAVGLVMLGAGFRTFLSCVGDRHEA